MFWNEFFKAVFWFFAIFGIFSIFYDIAAFFMHCGHEKDELYTIVAVKESSDAEAFVRSVIWQNTHTRGCPVSDKIIIVNLCSDGETEKILRRIACDYSFVHVTDPSGCADFIKSLHN